MKRVLQVIILALLCLTLVFISKARLDLALTIVPEAADDGGSGETVDTLAKESIEAYSGSERRRMLRRMGAVLAVLALLAAILIPEMLRRAAPEHLRQ